MNKNKQPKTMEENNKLIAEFMNYPKCSDYWKDGRFLEEDYKDYYYVRGQYDACYNSSNFHVNDMKFGLSWDWLMPVVNKCLNIYHIEQMNDDLNFKFYDSMGDIKKTYKAVLEFIKDYNNGKN